VATSVRGHRHLSVVKVIAVRWRVERRGKSPRPPEKPQETILTRPFPSLLFPGQARRSRKLSSPPRTECSGHPCLAVDKLLLIKYVIKIKRKAGVVKRDDSKRVKKVRGRAGRELPAPAGANRVTKEGRVKSWWWRVAGSPGEAIGAS
jgi:hypothetical protein